jgi:hypothetical protein
VYLSGVCCTVGVWTFTSRLLCALQDDREKQVIEYIQLLPSGEVLPPFDDCNFRL